MRSRRGYRFSSGRAYPTRNGPAARDQLKDPAVLEAQARRMLKDPRSRALSENFAGQWLQLRNLRGLSPDPRLFPGFDDDLRQAMQRESELFFESILAEDRSLLSSSTPSTRLSTNGWPATTVSKGSGGTSSKVDFADGRRGGLSPRRASCRSPRTPSGPHREAGQVDHGADPRHPAAPCPARCPRARSPGRPVDRLAQAEDGAAPQGSQLRDLPRADGSAWLRPGKLRSDRRWRDKDGEYPVDPSGNSARRPGVLGTSRGSRVYC